MASLIEERIGKQENERFAPLIMVDYYETIKELITAILLLDGYKTLSHKDLIDYLKSKYSEFSEYEISLLNDLRILRNRIAYEGFFVPHSYLSRNKAELEKTIQKLKGLIKNRLK